MAAQQRKRTVNRNRVVTAGTTITFEEPKSQRGKPSAARVVVEEINPVTGFVGFLRDHAIVGLSIGFIIGNQMSGFVRILVDNFIDPTTKLLFGTALSQRVVVWHLHGRTATVGWGIIVYNILIIFILLVFIYLAIKIFNLDKLDKPKEEKK